LRLLCGAVIACFLSACQSSPPAAAPTAAKPAAAATTPPASPAIAPKPAASPLAAASPSAAAPAVSPVAADSTKPVRIGAVTGNFSNPAVKAMVDAMQLQMAKYPTSTFLVQDSANVQEQIAKAETMLGQGIDVLGLHPWDGNAIQPLIKQAHDKGVKVFLLIDDAPGAVDSGNAISYISGDEVAGGRLLGEWLSGALADGGKIAILEGTPGNFSATYRSQGFKEGIAKNTKLSVVAEATGNWQRDQGLNAATNMLTANPDLAVLFAHNDEMAFGALQALKSAGKFGKVTLIGYNGTCIGIEATLKGDFQADGILPIPQIGSLFIDNAVKAGSGGTVEKRIEPEILALSTADAKAIQSGSKTVDPSLKQRIDDAAAGKC
jgi:ABC-type sugar transport system substrate-binding protein